MWLMLLGKCSGSVSKTWLPLVNNVQPQHVWLMAIASDNRNKPSNDRPKGGLIALLCRSIILLYVEAGSAEKLPTYTLSILVFGKLACETVTITLIFPGGKCVLRSCNRQMSLAVVPAPFATRPSEMTSNKPTARIQRNRTSPREVISTVVFAEPKSTRKLSRFATCI